MKVYTRHEPTRRALEAKAINGVTFVDEKHQADYIIDGHYRKLDHNPNLKGVIIPYTGHNGIDLDAMREQHLKLFVTPVRSKYVAEKAITLMFALLGNVVEYHELLKEGNWNHRNSDKRVPWVSIQNKTIGLFGYGRIGSKIHTMLSGFNVDFATIDRGKEYPETLLVVKNLTNLIQVSDVIIISTPLNHETRSIFDKNKFARMNHKYLINVARGPICDEEALYTALKNKTLKGYASDVWYNYPKGKEIQLPSMYPIYELDNVVLSNHSGGYTETTNDEVNEALKDQLIRLRDEDYSGELDLEKLL
jgi:phosphoglycerate dehydrogenase-like enzyme